MHNLLPAFIQEQYQHECFEGDFQAVTVFVDVSGFTPMTQALMAHGQHGAEVLAAVMNSVFDGLLDQIYERGGFVSVFAGDAFTAIFPLSQTLSQEEFILHILACLNKLRANSLQQAIQDTALGQFTLQFKMGVSYGTVQWGIVGQAEKTFFFRGPAIDACAASEHHAEKGDLIFDDAFGQVLRKFPKIAGGLGNVTMVSRGYYRLQKFPDALLKTLKKPKLPRRKALDRKVVAHFVPAPVLEFSATGEFRTVTVLFISFEGISTTRELDEWAALLLHTITAFGGYFAQLDFGDKGGTALCGFGAPVSHEKMAVRAIEWIMTVQDGLRGLPALANLKFRAGITYGVAYAGIAGGDQRCVYTYYGDVVNLAARLMMKAEWGAFFASEPVYRRANTRFAFEAKGPIAYKGFAEPLPTYRVLHKQIAAASAEFADELVGRQTEVQQLVDFAAPILSGQCAGVAYIYGEAGIGKSRLAYALRETLQQQTEIAWCHCPADQVLRTPFNPFKTFFLRYFEQASERTEAENKAQFEAKYAELIENLTPAPQPDKKDSHCEESATKQSPFAHIRKYNA